MFSKYSLSIHNNSYKALKVSINNKIYNLKITNKYLLNKFLYTY